VEGEPSERASTCTFNYGYVGTRATGTYPGDYLVVGPGWKGEWPPGIREVLRSSTQFSIAIFRTSSSTRRTWRT